MNSADWSILQRIVALQKEEPLRLEELASRLRMTAPGLLPRLKRLAEAGWLVREQRVTASGRAVFYLPCASFEARWVSPTDGVAHAWQLHGEPDWRFPLLSQLPDERGRLALRGLLRKLDQQKLLDPSDGEYSRGDDPRRRWEHLGLSLVAYGSCARGDAREGSDVDVLIIYDDDARHDFNDFIPDTVAEVSLMSARPIEAALTRIGKLAELPRGIRDAVQRDGLVIYDGLRDKPQGATRGVMRFVYGTGQRR